ncbi:hypothetical protein Gogos_003475, partial [Gossypium gossypioides]|nr:hypothetical protein [Gossypium gossypioides]
MWGVYHHFGGHAVTVGVTGGWVHTHRAAQSADWGAICYDLLGVISNIIYRGRIDIGWLPETFPVPRDDSIEVQKVRYAWAYILQIIRGYLMLDKS